MGMYIGRCQYVNSYFCVVPIVYICNIISDID